MWRPAHFRGGGPVHLLVSLLISESGRGLSAQCVVWPGRRACSLAGRLAGALKLGEQTSRGARLRQFVSSCGGGRVGRGRR